MWCAKLMPQYNNFSNLVGAYMNLKPIRQTKLSHRKQRCVVVAGKQLTSVDISSFNNNSYVMLMKKDVPLFLIMMHVIKCINSNANVLYKYNCL